MNIITFFGVLFVVVNVSQTQPVPYLTFNGFNLSNHSYIALEDVGDDDTDRGVECHTDLTTCCTSMNGEAAGYWFHPDGSRPPFTPYIHVSDMYMRRGTQKVFLYRYFNQKNILGIFQCNVPTSHTKMGIIIYAGIYNKNKGTVLKIIIDSV